MKNISESTRMPPGSPEPHPLTLGPPFCSFSCLFSNSFKTNLTGKLWNVHKTFQFISSSEQLQLHKINMPASSTLCTNWFCTVTVRNIFGCTFRRHTFHLTCCSTLHSLVCQYFCTDSSPMNCGLWLFVDLGKIPSTMLWCLLSCDKLLWLRGKNCATLRSKWSSQTWPLLRVIIEIPTHTKASYDYHSISFF